MIVNPDRLKRGLWWDRSWTIVDGCTHVSPGCVNCWSAARSHMWQHHPNAKIRARHAGLTTDAGAFNGTVRVRTDNLDLPTRVKKPTRFAVWNDVFHKAVSNKTIEDVYRIMHSCQRHTFVVLTQRARRMLERLALIAWHDPSPLNAANVINGVSICKQSEVNDIWYVQQAECGGPRMLSIEPLLEPLDMSRNLGGLAGIDWIVVGCETGPKRRPCKVEWVRSIVRQGKAAGAAVFVKALDLDGRAVKDLEQFPADLQLRELPGVMAKIGG